MDKKIFSLVLLTGVLVLIGAGCGNKNINNGQPASDNAALPAADENANSTDIYRSAKEIATPNALASELKSILSEACGEVKFTAKYGGGGIPATLVYVWKNKPTAEKLESAFKKNGYSIEVPGEALIVKKGNEVLSISWVEEMDNQEIGVGGYQETK